MTKAPPKRAEKREWSAIFARRFDLAKKARNKSSADISRALNLTRASVSSWLSEETAPSVDNLYRLSEILGVSIEWLLGRGPDDLPMLEISTPLDRNLVSLVAAAILHVMREKGLDLTPEDLSALILKGHDWAASEKRDGRSSSPESIANFIRYAL